MKKTLLVTSLLATSVFASVANAGTINITGNIAMTQCVADTTAPTITMPDINLNKLGATVGDTSDASTTDIIIKLTDCPAVKQTVKVTFTGTEDAIDSKALKLNNVGGIALALFEEDGTTAVDINKPAKDKLLNGSVTHDLKYKAKYVTTDTTFITGKAEAVLGFDINYN
ncbi:hypothetical protein BD65_1007 [Yersinia ruckeri]|uniref:fimbrial protein n=1 Tax=Yersinia ruckeri TaxID=29486 RepID=UPI0005ABF78A|nr:fimbrial protein [Yersinia ruckeri]AJI94338.1 hypothetical protein BD65_1007 [Yersinia ruckeri]